MPPNLHMQRDDPLTFVRDAYFSGSCAVGLLSLEKDTKLDKYLWKYTCFFDTQLTDRIVLGEKGGRELHGYLLVSYWSVDILMFLMLIAALLNLFMQEWTKERALAEMQTLNDAWKKRANAKFFLTIFELFWQRMKL